jgi:hypothetical protein
VAEHADEAGVAARVTAFATLGAMGVTQDLAHACLESMVDADPELIAEETLCLVATATARALELALEAHPDLSRSIVACVGALPHTYRDYLVGGAMIAQQKPELADANREVAQRLDHKLSFYQIHLPPGQFPGEQVLNDRMALWMGRISSPGQPDMPVARLERLALVPTLLTHLRLVLAFSRKEASALRG